MESLKEFSTYTKRYITKKDTYAIMANAKALGIDDKLIAENAGTAIADIIKLKFKRSRILFICGNGSKGAMGLAAARHCLGYPSALSIAFMNSVAVVSNEAADLNYKLLKDIEGAEIIDSTNIGVLRSMIRKSDVIVDAILGAGMHGRLTQEIAAAIKEINSSNKIVISIDVPTGIDADTGLPNTAHIDADTTLCVYKVKKGLQKCPPAGNIGVIDIGFPPTVELLSGPGDVILATEPRSIDANKYTHGTALVIGAGSDFKGASVLASFSANSALSALRGGSGYVTILLPRESEVLVNRPDLIVKPMKRDRLSKEDLDTIKSIRHNTLIIGSGLPKDVRMYQIIAEVIKRESQRGSTVVADATAVKAMNYYKGALGPRVILTPHEGEFKDLTGVDVRKMSFRQRIYEAIDFARNHRCTLVLKGHDTIITNGELLKINRAETPALSTMGTGDVLCGLIASYAGVHDNPFESAVAAVHVHSMIGDTLYRDKGLHATAEDVIERIPDIMKKYDLLI